MKLLNRVFFETKMTWLRVVFYSVAIAVLTTIPLVLSEKLLGNQNNSFCAPGQTFEFWILAAMFIILNCDKPVEAGLKTSVFFLISQPLIYLMQVPFSWQGWDLFNYYPLWFYWTVATLPGGMIAWFAKKGNWLSVPIISVATLFLSFYLVTELPSVFGKFPEYFLKFIFIIFEILVLVLLTLKDIKKRVVAFGLVLAVIAGTLFYLHNSTKTFVYELEGKAPYTLVSDIDYFGGNLSVEIKNNSVTITTVGDVIVPLEFKDNTGKVYVYNFSSDGDFSINNE